MTMVCRKSTQTILTAYLNTLFLQPLLQHLQPLLRCPLLFPGAHHLFLDVIDLQHKMVDED
jgi:hypothetical protein